MAGETDPIDEFAAALFSAARRERPSDDVRDRALYAITSRDSGATDQASPESSSPEVRVAAVASVARRSRYGAILALAAAVAAVAGGVVVFRGRGEPVFSIGPEVSSHREEARAAPSLSNIEDLPAPEPVQTAPTADRAARPRPPSRASRDAAATQKVEVAPPASLPDEIAALDRARTALTSGDPAGALRVLDEYERVLRGTRLTAEATMLRIDALARSGRATEASSLAARFVEANPGSALADRARAFIRSQGHTRVDAGGSP
jgi:hypothetical protein